MNDVSYLSSDVLYKEISKLISKDVSLFDAIIEFCDKSGMEIELVGTILKKNSSVKTLIVADANKLNLLKK